MKKLNLKKIMLGTSLLGLPFVSTADNYCQVCQKEHGLSDFSFEHVPCPDAIGYFENNIQHIAVAYMDVEIVAVVLRMAAERLGVEWHDWNGRGLDEGSFCGPMYTLIGDIGSKIDSESDLLRIDSAMKKYCTEKGFPWRAQDDVDVAQADQ